MAKTIATQYGEFLNYDNLVRIPLQLIMLA